MKRGEPVNYLVAGLAFILIALLAGAAYAACLPRVGGQERIAGLFPFAVPDGAALVVKEDSVSFGEGRCLYLYELSAETTARLAAGFGGSGWSSLPFPPELKQALKETFGDHAIGEQLQSRGFYTSNQGYFLFADLKGKKIDFPPRCSAPGFAGYTFCIFDVRNQQLLLFADMR
ncbi:MAG: hypothetical protein DBY36_05500 [Clostridiales bacterium]|nr:MAG: hypothetical protein DBY36_05500 [Clostridiales bacterium]